MIFSQQWHYDWTKRTVNPPISECLICSVNLQTTTATIIYSTICGTKSFSALSNPSVLWCCWLGGRKGIRPVKNWVVGAGVVICLERDADLHMAQLMPLPLTVSCFSKIQIGFTFLVPAHPRSPGQRAVKQVCVYVELAVSPSALLASGLKQQHRSWTGGATHSAASWR